MGWKSVRSKADAHVVALDAIGKAHKDLAAKGGSRREQAAIRASRERSDMKRRLN